MRRMMFLLAIASCAGAIRPVHLAAQCHQECVYIFDADRNIIGRGCVVNLDMFTTCLATATFCIQDSCAGAFLTDANGAVLAEADICRDKVTLKPVRWTGDDSGGTKVAREPDASRRKARPAAAAIE